MKLFDRALTRWLVVSPAQEPWKAQTASCVDLLVLDLDYSPKVLLGDDGALFVRHPAGRADFDDDVSFTSEKPATERANHPAILASSFLQGENDAVYSTDLLAAVPSLTIAEIGTLENEAFERRTTASA
jgi:hypothetical protein